MPERGRNHTHKIEEKKISIPSSNWLNVRPPRLPAMYWRGGDKRGVYIVPALTDAACGLCMAISEPQHTIPLLVFRSEIKKKTFLESSG